MLVNHEGRLPKPEDLEEPKPHLRLASDLVEVKTIPTSADDEFDKFLQDGEYAVMD